MDFTDFKVHKMNTTLIAERVLDHTEMLCEALRQNYIDQCIRGHEGSLRRLEGNTDTAIGYHQRCIAELKAGNSPVKFTIESGRKYHKIVFTDGGGQRSVHAFVDRNTGEVYKSASWKAPAKGVRYDLRLIKDREWLLENADWAGGYLYA
jgi:hypothetical protein